MTVADTEAQLVESARLGNVAAFSELVRRHDEAARSLAYRMVRSTTLMDDVLQDAYIKAFQGVRRFRGDSSFGTWLYRIVYNVCVDRLRQESREAPIAPVTGAARFEEAVVLRMDLATSLAQLPVKQRAALVLIDGLGLDYAEAAAVMKVPVGTIRSRLSRGRRALAAMMDTGETE